MTEPSIDVLVNAFLKCRDNLARLKKAFEKEKKSHENAMEVIGNKLQELADAQGVDSFATPHGTAFKSKKDFIIVDDWDAALKHIIDADLKHMLTKKVTKTAAKEYMEANSNKLPPGLRYGSITEIKVRRK